MSALCGQSTDRRSPLPRTHFAPALVLSLARYVTMVRAHVPESDKPAYRVDTQRWPLVYTRPPATDLLATGVFREFYLALDELLARRRPYVVVVDMRGLQPSPIRGQLFAEWVAARSTSIRDYMIALAYVVTADGEREYVTDTFFALEQSFHARLFPDLAEAEHWLLSEYARREAPNYA